MAQGAGGPRRSEASQERAALSLVLPRSTLKISCKVSRFWTSADAVRDLNTYTPSGSLAT